VEKPQTICLNEKESSTNITLHGTNYAFSAFSVKFTNLIFFLLIKRSRRKMLLCVFFFYHPQLSRLVSTFRFTTMRFSFEEREKGIIKHFNELHKVRGGV
jgi:hypothetical protein